MNREPWLEGLRVAGGVTLKDRQWVVYDTSTRDICALYPGLEEANAEATRLQKEDSRHCAVVDRVRYYKLIGQIPPERVTG